MPTAASFDSFPAYIQTGCNVCLQDINSAECQSVFPQMCTDGYLTPVACDAAANGDLTYIIEEFKSTCLLPFFLNNDVSLIFLTSTVYVLLFLACLFVYRLGICVYPRIFRFADFDQSVKKKKFSRAVLKLVVSTLVFLQFLILFPFKIWAPGFILRDQDGILQVINSSIADFGWALPLLLVPYVLELSDTEGVLKIQEAHHAGTLLVAGLGILFGPLLQDLSWAVAARPASVLAFLAAADQPLHIISILYRLKPDLNPRVLDGLNVLNTIVQGVIVVVGWMVTIEGLYLMSTHPSDFVNVYTIIWMIVFLPVACFLTLIVYITWKNVNGMIRHLEKKQSEGPSPSVRTMSCTDADSVNVSWKTEGPPVDIESGQVANKFT
eukprot:Clim_evm2s57 gene=Clim_evmTU2s57